MNYELSFFKTLNSMVPASYPNSEGLQMFFLTFRRSLIEFFSLGFVNYIIDFLIKNHDIFKGFLPVFKFQVRSSPTLRLLLTHKFCTSNFRSEPFGMIKIRIIRVLSGRICIQLFYVNQVFIQVNFIVLMNMRRSIDSNFYR